MNCKLFLACNVENRPRRRPELWQLSLEKLLKRNQLLVIAKQKHIRARRVSLFRLRQSSLLYEQICPSVFAALSFRFEFRVHVDALHFGEQLEDLAAAQNVEIEARNIAEVDNQAWRGPFDNLQEIFATLERKRNQQD